MHCEKINRVLRKRGEKYLCELTGKTAEFRLKDEPIFFSTKKLFQLWWDGIGQLAHHEIACLKDEKRLENVTSEEHRKQLVKETKQMRRDVLELSTSTAKKFLVQGNFQLAIPGGLLALTTAKKIYGSESLEIVESYLLLAESNLGMRNLKIVENYLSLTNQVISSAESRNQDVSNLLQSSLHRNFGRLYAAQEKYAESMQSFATDVWFSSLHQSPDNIRPAVSYFHLGGVQEVLGNHTRAEALFKKAIEIYKNQIFIKKENIASVDMEEIQEILKHICIFRDKRRQTLTDKIEACESWLLTFRVSKLLGQPKLEFFENSEKMFQEVVEIYNQRRVEIWTKFIMKLRERWKLKNCYNFFF